MDEHEYLKKLIEDLKCNITDKINNLVSEFRISTESSRQGIKELYEERNRIDKELIFTKNDVDQIKHDVNNLGQKIDTYINEHKQRMSNVFWKLIAPVISAIVVSSALIYLGLK